MWINNNNKVVVLSTRNPNLTVILNDDFEQGEKNNIYNACKINYDINNLFNSKWYWFKKINYKKWQELFKKKIDNVFTKLDKKYKLIIRERDYLQECEILDKMCWFQYNTKPTNSEIKLLKRYTRLLVNLKWKINKYNSSIKGFDFWNGDIFKKPLDKLLSYSKKVENRQNKLMFLWYISNLIDNRIDKYLFNYLDFSDINKIK